jgi:putative ABC transport system ATP-binding protein
VRGDGPAEARLFEFDDLGVRGNGDRWRLRHVSGTLADCGLVALVGRSGSGKSTLLRCCNGLEAPDEGTIRFRGVDLRDLDVLDLRRRVGMVFQRPTPFPGTVRDNLRVAAPELDDAGARELLGRVRLSGDFLERTATELSGGEAQRLCLARSLAVGPEVLLMDEATSSLDPESRRALEQLTRGLADAGTPVVWVTHDLGQARALADRLVVVVDGHLASDAETATFLEGADGG